MARDGKERIQKQFTQEEYEYLVRVLKVQSNPIAKKLVERFLI
jgi:hypothetical protein